MRKMVQERMVNETRARRDRRREGGEGRWAGIGSVRSKVAGRTSNRFVSLFLFYNIDFDGALQQKAMTTHHNVTHLGRRDHVCPHEDCHSAFVYKHLLQRHLAKVHSSQTTEESDSAEQTDEEDEEATPTAKDKGIQRMDIDTITGMSYTSNANERLSSSKALRCPHPHLGTLVHLHRSDDVERAGASTSKGCDYVFSRAYDLRRHLRVEHGVEVEKERVDDWVKAAKAEARKNRRV
jgi:general transcription factor IIIA